MSRRNNRAAGGTKGGESVVESEVSGLSGVFGNVSSGTGVAARGPPEVESTTGRDPVNKREEVAEEMQKGRR